MKKVIIVVSVIFAVIILAAACPSKPDKTSTNKSKQEAHSSESTPEVDNSIYHWQYNEKEDEMTSEKVTYARIYSSDEVTFDFPYHGGSELSLTMRRTGKKLNAWITISKGQFINSLTDPKISIRFDEDKPMSFQVDDPADYDSSIKFINKPEILLERLKNCKTFKIQCTFYNEGSPVFNFENVNFKDL